MRMTPAAIKREIEAFWERESQLWDRAQWQSWATGYFVQCAIGSSFSKRFKYPENPLKQKSESIKEIAKRNHKSEAELQQELQFMSRLVDQANANIEKRLKRRGGQE